MFIMLDVHFRVHCSGKTAGNLLLILYFCLFVCFMLHLMYGRENLQNERLDISTSEEFSCLHSRSVPHPINHWQNGYVGAGVWWEIRFCYVI